jgi:hypothetical protein
MANPLRNCIFILKFILMLILWYKFPIVGGILGLILMIWWYCTWKPS